MALHARAWRAVIVLALAAWCSLAGVSSASVEQFSVDAFRISLSLSLSLEKIGTSFYLSLSFSLLLPLSLSLFQSNCSTRKRSFHNSSNAHIEIHCPSPEKTINSRCRRRRRSTSRRSVASAAVGRTTEQFRAVHLGGALEPRRPGPSSRSLPGTRSRDADWIHHLQQRRGRCVEAAGELTERGEERSRRGIERESKHFGACALSALVGQEGGKKLTPTPPKR